MADYSPEIYRVAVFGGSFDPIHAGHIATAERAMEQFNLHRVLWIPAAKPPHKLGKELAPDHARLAMTLLGTVGRLGWQVLTLEFNRSGPSYTYDTLLEIPDWIQRYLTTKENGGIAPRRRKLELYLIIGSDNLPGLPSWKNAEDVLSIARPIVAWRHGDPDALLADLKGKLSAKALERISSGFMRLEPIDQSSTAVREALGRGEVPGDALHDEVLKYIQEQGLYGWPKPTTPRDSGEGLGGDAGGHAVDPAVEHLRALSKEGSPLLNQPDARPQIDEAEDPLGGHF